MLAIRDDEVNITDAAAILGVHRISVHKWCRSGYLKCRRRARVTFPILAAVLALKKRRDRVAKLAGR